MLRTIVPAPVVTPRNLSLSEAAKYLCCTPWFLRTCIWERKIPFLLFGRKYAFDRADLDKFIEKEKQR